MREYNYIPGNIGNRVGAVTVTAAVTTYPLAGQRRNRVTAKSTIERARDYRREDSECVHARLAAYRKNAVTAVTGYLGALA
jgi:hypothetical protein